LVVEEGSGEFEPEALMEKVAACATLMVKKTPGGVEEPVTLRW